VPTDTGSLLLGFACACSLWNTLRAYLEISCFSGCCSLGFQPATHCAPLILGLHPFGNFAVLKFLCAPTCRSHRLCRVFTSSSLTGLTSVRNFAVLKFLFASILQFHFKSLVKIRYCRNTLPRKINDWNNISGFYTF